MKKYIVKYRGKIVMSGNFSNSKSAKKTYKNCFEPSVNLSHLSATKIPKGYVLVSHDKGRTFRLKRK